MEIIGTASTQSEKNAAPSRPIGSPSLPQTSSAGAWRTVIKLPFPPSVNGLFAGKKRRYVSPHYRAWRQQAGWQLVSQRIAPVSGRVHIAVELTAPDRRERDADNYLKALQDLLVTHGVIPGDGKSVIVKVSAEWTTAREVGAIVTITPA